MDRCDVILYIKKYYDCCTEGLEKNKKGSYYLSYARWACIEAIKAIYAEPNKSASVILEGLCEKFDEYATYSLASTSMFSCARDTILDIWDHVAYPNDYY